jgi:hypothetical protein
MLLRFTGLIALILGILFWTRNALALVPIHMLLGIIIVLALWTLAFLAARAGVSIGLVALAFVWGVIVVVLGMTQTSLLPGSLHWIVQVIHLLVGLGAMGQGETLAARIKRSQAAVPQP